MIRFGTILQRNYPELAVGVDGYWWRKRMVEEGFASSNQIDWRLDRIPFNAISPGTLFISQMDVYGETITTHFMRRDGTRLPLNDHLGQVLRDYLILLTDAIENHNHKIANSNFPLVTIRNEEPTAFIVEKIRGYQANSHNLQAHLRVFKGTWEANKSMCPATYRGYQNGPAQWVDEAIAANDAAIADATSKVDTHGLRMRQQASEEAKP